MIRKPTKILRETVMQEIREVLPPEMDAPSHAYRRIQILTPADPPVWVWATDGPNENIANREGYGRGTYKGPTMPGSNNIDFVLGPTQTLWAAAESGIAHLSLVVEYLGG